jgi:hypothetical protein
LATGTGEYFKKKSSYPACEENKQGKEQEKEEKDH